VTLCKQVVGFLGGF